MYDDENQVSQAPAPSYEFTPQENSVISGLLTSVMIVAIGWFCMALLLGGLGALVLVKSGGGVGVILSIPLLLAGAIMFLLGKDLWRAANSMRVITNSEGNDIANLVQAVKHIGDYFRMILYIVIIVFIVALIGLIGSAG